MSVYQATVDPAERNTSHTMMLELVGSDKDVLDVGCASGYLAEALGRNGCRVSGVEYDPTEAEKARPFLVDLVVADLNEVDLAGQLPGASYDAIVFGDVLEHLLDPDAVLTSSLALLREGGSIVISIPNVAHGSVRLALLQGRWNYSDTGLLDRTHIRFFTFDTLLAMLERAGLTVTELRSTVADPLGTEITVDQTVLPPDTVDWVRRQAHSQAYQFVLTAERAERAPEHRADGHVSDGHVSDRRVPHVLPAVPLPEVHDVHAEVVELKAAAVGLHHQIDGLQATVTDLEEALTREHTANTVLRRAVLTSRDHAIGHEAQLGRLRAELATVRHQLHTTTLDAQYAHSELAKSIADAQAAHARLAILRWFRHPIRHGVWTMAGGVRRALPPRVWRALTTPIRPLIESKRASQ